jgi:hypothetical protein
MLLDPKSGAPTRTKARYDEDKDEKRSRTKERVSAETGEPIPRVH